MTVLAIIASVRNCPDAPEQLEAAIASLDRAWSPEERAALVTARLEALRRRGK